MSPPLCLTFAPPRTAASVCGMSELVCTSGGVCELAAAGRLMMVSTLVGVAEGITSSDTTAASPAGHALLPVMDLMWGFAVDM